MQFYKQIFQCPCHVFNIEAADTVDYIGVVDDFVDTEGVEAACFQPSQRSLLKVVEGYQSDRNH